MADPTLEHARENVSDDNCDDCELVSKELQLQRLSPMKSTVLSGKNVTFPTGTLDPTLVCYDSLKGCVILASAQCPMRGMLPLLLQIPESANPES